MSGWWLPAALAGPALLALITVLLTARATARVPRLGAMIDLGRARLHVLDTGGAADRAVPVIVMIHGLGGQLRHFTHGLVDRLRGDHRVVALDRPGAGYSVWKGEASWNLDAQADVVAELIERAALGRVVLVGHSLGGALALRVAQRHRAHIAGLALLAPLTDHPQAISAALRRWLTSGRWVLVVLAWTIAMPLGRARRRALLGPVFSPDSIPDDYAVAAGGDLTLRPGHFLAAARDLAGIPDLVASLRAGFDELAQGEPLPIGVLYGRQDRVLSARVHGEGLLACLPHARLELIDAGHMLPIMVPDACDAFIRRCVVNASGL